MVSQNLLLHRGKTLGQNGSKLFDQMRTVSSRLQLNNDGLDDVVADRLEINIGLGCIQIKAQI